VTSNVELDATTTSLDMTSSTTPQKHPAPTGAKALSGVPQGGSRPASPRQTQWRRNYARRLWITDLLALIWSVYGTQLLWFGWGNAQVAMRQDSRITELSYWGFSGLVIVLWMLTLSLIDSRSFRIIGHGITEYVRVVDGSLRLFGAIAIVAFLTRIDVARGYLLIALPLGVLMLLATRWLWRQWLNAQRVTGAYSARVLLVGSLESVTQIAKELARTPTAGYSVVGACLPDETATASIPGADIPVVSTVNSINRAIAATGADTVAITSTDDLPPAKVKEISWSLEAGKQHLVLAPSILDIAGPRIHMRPVAGLPLVHVETPRFSVGQRLVKRVMDVTVATVGVIVISPLLLVLALTVRLTSPGPVLFRQTRVGLRGRPFTMLKFRSMVLNAEDLLNELARGQRDSGNTVMFKMKHDPRVTPVGRLMRKFSLDELPQLFNVIDGSMSLVGPRPPLPSEVEQYADHVHRRFLVKPGITGLWQVSGRSSLSWEDTVRLDLSYVENWSVLGDIAILAKTAKAALAPGDTAH
jgi:exopolysaccharide biosynthesis polyprenyl glycosylphosphotransferase